jgi:hypothetical protein
VGARHTGVILLTGAGWTSALTGGGKVIPLLFIVCERPNIYIINAARDPITYVELT